MKKAQAIAAVVSSADRWRSGMGSVQVIALALGSQGNDVAKRYYKRIFASDHFTMGWAGLGEPQAGVSPSVLRTRNGPMASTSMRVRLKQSIASSGTHTIGSFSLKLVFRITGIPVLRSKARMRS